MISKNSIRIDWPDASRGIAIVIVLLFHVVITLQPNDLIPQDQETIWLTYAISSFACPPFFFLAGLNFKRIWKERAEEKFRRHTLRLTHAFILWSTLQISLMIVMPQTNNLLTFSALLAIPLLPQMQFWFLWALIAYKLITWLLPPKALLPAAAIIFILSFVGDRESLIAARTAYWFPYFVAGVLIERERVSGWLAKWANGTALATTALLFTASAAAAGMADGLRLYSPFALLPGLIGTVLTLTIAFRLSSSAILQYLGRHSLALLVMHIMAGGAVRLLIVWSGLPIPWQVTFTAVFVAYLAGPLIALAVMERLGIAHWFGLAPWPRRPSTIPPSTPPPITA